MKKGVNLNKGFSTWTLETKLLQTCEVSGEAAEEAGGKKLKGGEGKIGVGEDEQGGKRSGEEGGLDGGGGGGEERRRQEGESWTFHGTAQPAADRDYSKET